MLFINDILNYLGPVVGVAMRPETGHSWTFEYNGQMVEYSHAKQIASSSADGTVKLWLCLPYNSNKDEEGKGHVQATEKNRDYEIKSSINDASTKNI